MARLGDIATVITKGTTPTSLGFDFVSEGINFIKIESIAEDGSFIPSKFGHIDSACNIALKRSQLEENDILFSIAGAIGRTAIVKKEILPANTNQALAIIRIPEGTFDYSFLLYVLQSPNLIEQFEKKKQGVAQLNISLKDISDFVVPDISMEEQKKIASNLSKVDELISCRKEQLSKLDELVKAIFIELFGERLERDTVKLSALTEVITKGTTPTTLGFEFTENGVNFVKIECITEDCKFIVPKMLHISDECNKKLKRSILYEGDVLFSIAGAIGRTAIVTKEILPANTNQAVAIIRLKKDCGLNAKFLNQMLHSSLIEKQVSVKKAGVAQINLSLADIGDFNVIVPPIEEQNQFATFVEQTEKTKAEVQKSLDELETLKKSLMQKYFG